MFVHGTTRFIFIIETMTTAGEKKMFGRPSVTRSFSLFHLRENRRFERQTSHELSLVEARN